MRIALILAGCGQNDGSETHEVVLTLLSLAQEKVEWDAFAPDIQQSQVINHVTNTQESEEKRSVLKEASRLVRGKIKPLSEAKVDNYDAVIFPGGVGAVSHLCNWIEKHEEFTFNPDVKIFIDKAINQGLPMGFICIAPMMIPKIFKHAELTIGNDKSLAEEIGRMGATHKDCKAEDIIIDVKNKVVSTPANMVANNIVEVYEGIHKLVKALVEIIKSNESK